MCVCMCVCLCVCVCLCRAREAGGEESLSRGKILRVYFVLGSEGRCVFWHVVSEGESAVR